MKIVIDISPLKSAHRTRGIGIYTKHLIKALKKVDGDNQYVLTSRLSRHQADIVHYPYFDFFSRTIPLSQKIKTVVTIHDTIPLVFPAQYKPGLRGKLNYYFQKLALQKVSSIITDSNNSKQDIHKYLNQLLSKINVVYLAADEVFKPASQSQIRKTLNKYKLQGPFILYVGDINYNKNIPALIKAFASVYTSTSLVLVARALKNRHLDESKVIFKTIKETNVEAKLKILTDVPIDPPQDLIALYTAAKLYVQPSLYEGFGLPVLEAMVCNTPVACAKAASLPEVAGDAVIYFDPKNIEDIKNTIAKGLNLGNQQRKALVEKGQLQAKKFTWEQTAKKTIEVYQSLS